MKKKKTPTKRAGTKTSGFFLRMTPEEKAVLVEAAKAEKRTLANFLIMASLERAKAAR